MHPWSTWPTVHRGVDNRVHNIRFINQDLNKANKYKAIWEILSENKIDVAVFGSLQSFPPKKNKYYKFYLPDTFAPSPEAYPNELSIFQDFNLSLVGENKAISRKISIKNIKDFIYLIAKGIISKRSAFKAFLQILKEKINSKYKTERSMIQNILSFDIYFKYLNKYQPTFSTYFTNHLAGMMHRYWKNLFPNDFGLNKNQIDMFHAKSILKAMRLADKNLRKLILFSKKNNYELLVISSMGQASIDRGEYIPELVLRNFKQFIGELNLNSENYKLLPAMQPDYCIESRDRESMDELRDKIKLLTDKTGNYLFIERYKPEGLKVNFSLKNLKSVSKSGNCKINNINIKIEDMGLEFIRRDIGTAYHIPQGIMAWYGDKSYILKPFIREDIDTCRICPTILKIYGIDIPSYMKAPLI